MVGRGRGTQALLLKGPHTDLLILTLSELHTGASAQKAPETNGEELNCLKSE